VEHEVRVFPAIGKGAPSDLLIRVLEPPNGPRLGEELTDVDRVLIKWAEWLSNWTEHGENDLVISVEAPEGSPEGSMIIVSSPRHGFHFDVRMRSLSPDRPVVGYSLLATESENRLVSWHQGVVARWPLKGTGRIILTRV